MDWKRFFDSLGMNGTQWQWRIMRWQNRWDERKASWTQQKQHVTYQHKFCRCGKLLDRHEKTCPHCGARAPSWRAQSAARALGLVMPTACVGTPVLLVANIGIMLVLMLVYGGMFLFRPTNQQLVEAGALVPVLFFQGDHWSVITYGYLHAGLVHIFFNMFALTQLGTFLEKEIGTARFFSVYTLTLIGGGAADLLFRPHMPVPIIGASGAVFGLIGFGLSYAHFLGGPSGRMFRGIFLRWAMYGFVFGLVVPGIDNIAHGGGFAVGLVLGFLVERERLHRDALSPAWRMIAAVCLLATLGAFGWMLVG